MFPFFVRVRVRSFVRPSTSFTGSVSRGRFPPARPHRVSPRSARDPRRGLQLSPGQHPRGHPFDPGHAAVRLHLHRDHVANSNRSVYPPGTVCVPILKRYRPLPLSNKLNRTIF